MTIKEGKWCNTFRSIEDIITFTNAKYFWKNSAICWSGTEGKDFLQFPNVTTGQSWCGYQFIKKAVSVAAKNCHLLLSFIWIIRSLAYCLKSEESGTHYRLSFQTVPALTCGGLLFASNWSFWASISCSKLWSNFYTHRKGHACSWLGHTAKPLNSCGTPNLSSIVDSGHVISFGKVRNPSCWTLRLHQFKNKEKHSNVR